MAFSWYWVVELQRTQRAQRHIVTANFFATMKSEIQYCISNGINTADLTILNGLGAEITHSFSYFSVPAAFSVVQKTRLSKGC